MDAGLRGWCCRGSTARRITARALNPATLGRQVLLGRAALPTTEAVRRMVASLYLALWNRPSWTPPSPAMRWSRPRSVFVTLHAVHADD